MGWMETCAMDERMRLVIAVEKREESFSALCRRFNVSRKTGYKWLSRYDALGVEGLSDLSRAPHGHPHAIPATIAERCLQVRREHSTWGPAKYGPILHGGRQRSLGQQRARSAHCSTVKG